MRVAVEVCGDVLGRLDEEGLEGVLRDYGFQLGKDAPPIERKTRRWLDDLADPGRGLCLAEPHHDHVEFTQDQTGPCRIREEESRG